MSVSELASAAGISYQTLLNAEHAAADVRLGTLCRIGRVLGFTVEIRTGEGT